MKRKDETSKLYYFDQYPWSVCEEIELYTWKDACELAEKQQANQVDADLAIREFEPI